MKKIFSLLLMVLLLSVLAVPAFAANNTAQQLVLSYGLTPHAYAGGTDKIENAQLDNQGRLAVTAGGTAGNLFLGVPLGELAGTLEEYSVEAKLAGIGMNDGWHYGIGWNNSQNNSNENWYSMRTGAYNASKNNGELRCWVQKLNGIGQGSNDNKMGKPDTPFASMSAANGTDNVFKATVKKSGDATNISFYMNGVEVISLTDSVNEYTLLDFNIVIPYTTTVAISYMRVYDVSGAIVYNEQFGNASSIKHMVTVNYVYENNTSAATSATKEISEGAFYSIESPEIEGYIPAKAVVSGIMGNENITVTVIYRTMKTVTVHYVDSNGNQMFKDIVIDKLMQGDVYCIETIPVANYTADTQKVEGTVGSDNVEVTVTYTPKKYTLTVKYIYSDGTQAYEDYVGSFEYKTAYSIPSPAIEGYTADIKTVSSDSMGKDVTITVTYTKKQIEESTNKNDNSEETNSATELTTDTSQDSTEKSGCGSVIEMAVFIPLVIGATAIISCRKKD